MTADEITALKRDHRYCGFCGSKMGNSLEPSPSFDRITGKQGSVGHLYWKCRKYGEGIEAISGDWMMQYDDNPHDRTYIEHVTKA